MNTQLNIKTRRSLFSPTFVTLLIGVAVVLVLGSSTVQAQATTTAPVPAAAVVDSSITIAASGTVNDPNGPITVKGSVIVKCRRVLDTTSSTTSASAPLVLLDLDFSQLTGTSGTSRVQRVYVTGDNHATEIRPLQASDTIIVTSPYFDNTKDVLSASSWLVTANLNFDVSTGKVTTGSITIGDNVVSKATVGTIDSTAP
jgi:hypothetical protein